MADGGPREAGGTVQPRSPAGGGKRLAALIVAMLVLIASVLAVFLLSPPPGRWTVRSYSVAVSAPPGSEWTILVPIPVLVNGSTAPLIADLGNLDVREGQPALVLVATPFGLALNVSATGNVFMQASERQPWNASLPPSGSRHPQEDIGLNLWVEPDPDSTDYDLGSVRFYLDANVSGQQVTIDVLLHIEGIYHTAHLQGAQIGWQVVPVSWHMVVP